VIYRNYILHSEGPGRDHNDLLRSLAAKFRLNKDAVISNALRFYYTRQKDADNNTVIITAPVRKLDHEDFLQNRRAYSALITGEIK
jgi:phenolic acid decarboxylase